MFTRTADGVFTRSAELAADEDETLSTPLLPDWRLVLKDLFRAE